MKKSILTITAGVITLFSACSPKATSNKMELLDSLKGQQSKISEQIRTLEAELKKEGKLSESGKVKMVSLAEVKTQMYKHYIDIQGRLEADQNVTLSTKMGGAVVKINVQNGDDVSKNQVLAEIDDQIMLQGKAELEKGLELANIVYEKQKNLWDQKVGTEIQFLQAKNTKEGLEKKLQTLNEQIDMCKIRAPFSGNVDDMMLKLGQIVAPGVPCVRIINFSVLKAKADVAESYAGKIKNGNETEVFFPSIDKKVNSSISYVSKTINPITRSFFVEVNMENTSDFKPNMLAVLKIVDSKNEKAILVPVNTIYTAGDGQFVMTATTVNNKLVAKKTLVKIGSTYNGQSEILSGLKEGDKLIVVGHDGLSDGDAIKL